MWPTPPNIPRVRYTDYFAGMKLDYTPSREQAKKKSSWMDRLAGVQDPNNKGHFKPIPFQLLGPYGMAVNSKGDLYVADQKVGAIFVFNTETKDATLIRNGHEATFGMINAVAFDDDDRLFVTDGKLHRVLVFDKNNDVVDMIKDGLIDPVGIAIDTENRQLYVVDTQADQVVVYDADTLKEKRRIGTGGKQHELTTPGDFSLPTFVALDKDNNVYVTDTMNYRVEIFDADGNYISQFGKHCDGPGCFAHPKGIAVDSDGHIWVADPMLDILQAFNSRRAVAGHRGRTRQSAGTILVTGRGVHRQEQSHFYLRAISRASADVPLHHGCGSGSAEEREGSATRRRQGRRADARRAGTAGSSHSTCSKVAPPSRRLDRRGTKVGARLLCPSLCYGRANPLPVSRLHRNPELSCPFGRSAMIFDLV